MPGQPRAYPGAELRLQIEAAAADVEKYVGVVRKRWIVLLTLQPTRKLISLGRAISDALEFCGEIKELLSSKTLAVIEARMRIVKKNVKLSLDSVANDLLEKAENGSKKVPKFVSYKRAFRSIRKLCGILKRAKDEKNSVQK